MGLRRGFKTEAERISEQLREEMGLKPYEPLCGFDLAKHLNIVVHDFSSIPGATTEQMLRFHEDLDTAVSGMRIIGAQKQEIVVVNENHHMNRQQSTIFHEVAHMVLKHDHNPKQLIEPKVHLIIEDSDQEDEAKHLGSVLHLPKKSLEKYYLYGGWTKDRLSEEFQTSMQMLDMRLRLTGVEKRKLYRRR